MDSEKALELVKHGATLLFLDVPQHTLIGIDTQANVHSRNSFQRDKDDPSWNSLCLL
ncbi:hypothetical protein F2Q70_00044987 [Brassica cretica]|uniref:Uncharacterized protein n=1 Tax=Brassica cretica TaxID=69181 RepID=A0A8S9KHR3_BRACR|nr:hypothetical protein F2Q70_00044987 [Brassica cretica]